MSVAGGGLAADRLDAYVALIARFAARLDLVSPHDLPRLRTRHVDDSLRAAPLLGELEPGPCADVGSGAGLPGIPLAIVAPERRWTLIEPRHARAAFLEEVVRVLELDAEVLAARVEDVAVRRAGTYVLATARAFAAPGRSLAACLPLVRPGGVALAFVGERAEIPARAEEWRPGLAIVRRHPPAAEE